MVISVHGCKCTNMHTFEFFAIFAKVTNLTFLPMLYTWTNASVLSCIKMFSYSKDLIPDTIQNCTNIKSVCIQFYLANAIILWQDNIYTKKIATILAEMSDLSLLWKLWKTLLFGLLLWYCKFPPKFARRISNTYTGTKSLGSRLYKCNLCVFDMSKLCLIH